MLLKGALLPSRIENLSYSFGHAGLRLAESEHQWNGQFFWSESDNMSNVTRTRPCGVMAYRTAIFAKTGGSKPFPPCKTGVLFFAISCLSRKNYRERSNAMQCSTSDLQVAKLGNSNFALQLRGVVGFPFARSNLTNHLSGVCQS